MCIRDRAQGALPADLIDDGRAPSLPSPDEVRIDAPSSTGLMTRTDRAPAEADPGLGYIFEHTRGSKCLVFVNSREEAEAVCASLRAYCEANREPDRFLIHHGNLSASYRESAEELMRDDEQTQTTVTTATLEQMCIRDRCGSSRGRCGRRRRAWGAPRR